MIKRKARKEPDEKGAERTGPAEPLPWDGPPNIEREVPLPGKRVERTDLPPRRPCREGEE